MIKKAILTVFALVMILGLFSCSNKKKESNKNDTPATEDSTVLTNSHAIEKLSLDWFFVPKECKELKVKEANINKVELSFKGCGYTEINAYAADIEKAIEDCGYILFAPVVGEDGKIAGITSAARVKSVIEDEYYSGTPYSFIYKTDDGFTTITIKYYGSAGGKYGNGQCKVIIQDSTELYMPYYEVIKDE